MTVLHVPERPVFDTAVTRLSYEEATPEPFLPEQALPFAKAELAVDRLSRWVRSLF